MAIIADGTGTGNRAKVSGNRIFSNAVTERAATHATENGDSFNINTGNISLTSSTASGVLFLQNNENEDLVIEAVAAGVSSGGTTADVSNLTIIRNPTSVSFSTDVDMNQNRNFASSKVLASLAYKGAEGATVTGGDAIGQFFIAPGTRLFADVNLSIPKGKCMAITMDTNTTSGTTAVYAAVVCYLKNPDFKE